MFTRPVVSEGPLLFSFPFLSQEWSVVPTEKQNEFLKWIIVGTRRKGERLREGKKEKTGNALYEK